jgi:spore coat polysaccharide biosynthesis protein SpsF (cytidylyltransferase family)
MEIMSKNTIALVQARTSSRRLPKKVLLDTLGKPLIIHQLQRIKLSNKITKLIVVTSNNSSDDELSDIAQKFGFIVYRGELENVLKRFYDCLRYLNADDNDTIVRLTGDCPLSDAKIIDEAITLFEASDCQYLSNCHNLIYPDGFDVEVFSYEALIKTYKQATNKSDLEHVTPYMRQSNNFKIEQIKKTPIYPNWRLTIDQKEDFVLIETIYKHFNKTIFSFTQIIDFLENNLNLIEINKNIPRNDGYFT